MNLINQLRRIMALCILVNLLLWSMGCAKPSRNSVESTEWPYKSPCNPPCWNNITPNITSRNEAIRILQEDQRVQYMSLRDAVEWEQAGPGIVSGRIKHKARVVTNIQLRQDGTITVGNIVDVYGPPSHIFALAMTNPNVPNEIVHRFHIIYIEQGLSLEWGPAAFKPDSGLSWNEFNINFSPPGLDGYVESWGNPTILFDLVPWSDSYEFDDYCRGDGCLLGDDFSDYCQGDDCLLTPDDFDDYCRSHNCPLDSESGDGGS